MQPPRRPALTRLLLALTLLSCLGPGAAALRAEEVTIFAAASTTGALNEVVQAFEAQAFKARADGPAKPAVVRAVFAASSTLAKQITQGAPADLFLSASAAWMDYLEKRAALDPASRVSLLSNRLALIAPTASDLQLNLKAGAALIDALGDGRLAMGDPDHVPAGIYGKAALSSLGLWNEIAKRTARAANVRAALAMVERGEAAAGIVYRSDALGRDSVRVIDLFPADSHPEIAYPLAVVQGRGSAAVQDFARFLKSEAALAIFRRHGFATPAGG